MWSMVIELKCINPLHNLQRRGWSSAALRNTADFVSVVKDFTGLASSALTAAVTTPNLSLSCSRFKIEELATQLGQ